MFDILPEQPGDVAAIEALLDQAFGPGRFAKTAYRIREGTRPVEGLSFVARDGEDLLGSMRFTAVQAARSSLLFLGPLVVHPDHQNQSIGKGLIDKGLEVAKGLGHSLVLLIGDEPYYARSGFKHVPEGQLTLPGPFDPKRLLACELVGGALRGVVGELWAKAH